MAAPTYSATTIANSPVDHTAANTGTTRTTPSYSPASGTILVGAAASEDTSSCPIVSISGGPTWAQQYLNNSASKSSAALYTATAAGGSITSLVTATNGSIAKKFGLAVLQFTGSDGVGAKNTASGTTGFPSVSLTTTQDNSAIVAIVSDWSAVTGTSTFSNISSSTPVEVLDYADGATYGFHVAYWPDVGAAGAKTVAMSAPSGQNWIIQAIEVKGTSGGGVSGTATTGQGSQSAAASGSVQISGSATAGQGSQSAAVSASEKFSGTATTGQGSQSVSAAGGGASISGTATTAQGSQSAAVAGAQRIAGTATTGQGAQSCTAAGTETIAGTAATSQKSQSVLVAVEVRPAVDLLWDAPSGWTPDGYRVKWGTSSGNYTQTRDVGAGVLTITIWGLTPNTTYYWVVVGLSGTEEQTLSAESTFHTFPASAATGQGSQSVSASGSVRIAGTATTGQGSQSAAGNQIVISGTATSGQGSQAGAASGAITISGTATTGQGAQSAAGVGAGAAVSGPATTGQGSQSVSGSGAQTITGAGTTGQGSQSVVAAQLVITGTATTSQGSQNASGVGSGAAISGPATTSQTQSATAAAYVLITGVATTGQGLQSASGSGAAPPIDGTATTGQGSQSALSSGAGVIVGTCNTGQGSQSANAAGIQSIAGSASTRQTQSVNGNGSIQIIGTANTSQGSQSARGGISSYREFDIVTDDGRYHIYSITYVERLT